MHVTRSPALVKSEAKSVGKEPFMLLAFCIYKGATGLLFPLAWGGEESDMPSRGLVAIRHKLSTSPQCHLTASLSLDIRNVGKSVL
jgi:hypothetical protein